MKRVPITSPLAVLKPRQRDWCPDCPSDPTHRPHSPLRDHIDAALIHLIATLAAPIGRRIDKHQETK